MAFALPSRAAVDGWLLSAAVKTIGRFAIYSLRTKQLLPCRVVLGGKLFHPNNMALVEPFERDGRHLVRKLLNWDGVPNFGMRPENAPATLVFYLFQRTAKEVDVIGGCRETARYAGAHRYPAVFDPIDMTKSLYRERKA